MSKKSKKRKRKQEVKRLQREKQEALNIIGSYIRASRADYRLVLELKARIAELETRLKEVTCESGKCLSYQDEGEPPPGLTRYVLSKKYPPFPDMSDDNKD